MASSDDVRRLAYLADYSELGIIETAEGPDVKVFREIDGAVVFWEPDTGHTQTLDPAERDRLREILDRAAMPGQVPASLCPQPGCRADPATASGGLPPKWCTGDCSHGDGDVPEVTDLCQARHRLSGAFGEDLAVLACVRPEDHGEPLHLDSWDGIEWRPTETPGHPAGPTPKGEHMIVIYGASDDLVEVRGPGVDEEYSALGDATNNWHADLIAPDGAQMRVHAAYERNGCWSVGASPLDEDEAPFPDWPVTIRAYNASNGESSYSVVLEVGAPEGTKLVNVHPKPASISGD